ncbi:F0F1 ATP synthase subunit B [Prosthecobacter sp.]|uniref:F0F1 ATP synthase subunit B family protein n=1 Tax=Prosthecobacter sp. TaxID=1965333 RepID=UPI003783D557
MLIDWFTVVAQTLNFLILVWVMKRYLYQPVLRAIDAREKRIAAQIADADSREAAAVREKEEFQRKNAEFDQQRAGMLDKAAEDAKAERRRLIEEARQAADALSVRRDELLRSEAKNLHDSIVRRTQEEVFAIARKTLMDLAGVSLETRVAEVFASRLRAMDDAVRGSLAKALKNSAEPALIRSAFELPPVQRGILQQAVNEAFTDGIPLKFETAPGMVSGIELRAGGQKVAWSIAGYLDSLERGVGELLANATPAGKADEASPA